MKLFNFSNLRLLLMLLLIGFLFSFTNKRNKERKISQIKVVFEEDRMPFLSSEAVNKLLIENNEDPKSIEKVNLDLNKLEKKLNSHKMIEKSEVFVTINGVVKAIVKQKNPIARVCQETKSYYIDYLGTSMPLSANFTARVPLVSGAINTKDSPKITEVLQLIYNDDFLKKNIIGVEVMPNGSLKMSNRSFDYTIDFGTTTRMKAKFNNYKAFFQKAILNNSLDKYKTIDLRFSQQVVCTKK